MEITLPCYLTAGFCLRGQDLQLSFWHNGGVSKPKHNPGLYQSLNLEDTPDALSEGGFTDEYEAELEIRQPAVAVPGASFLTAFRNFYAQYWLRTGTSSGAEIGWAVLWLLAGTFLLFGSTGYMRDLIDKDQASSLVRTIYMLVFALDCFWVMGNLGPLGSVIARYRNYRAEQKARS